jgi:hypothetical protein
MSYFRLEMTIRHQEWSEVKVAALLEDELYKAFGADVIELSVQRIDPK